MVQAEEEVWGRSWGPQSCPSVSPLLFSHTLLLSQFSLSPVESHTHYLGFTWLSQYPSTRANQPSLGLRPKLTTPLARERGTKAQSSKVNHQLKGALPDPCSSHATHVGRESQEEQLRQD